MIEVRWVPVLFLIGVRPLFVGHLLDVACPSSPQFLPDLDGLLGGWNRIGPRAWFAQDSPDGIRQVWIGGPEPVVYCLQMACRSGDIEQGSNLFIS